MYANRNNFELTLPLCKFNQFPLIYSMHPSGYYGSYEKALNNYHQLKFYRKLHLAPKGQRFESRSLPESKRGMNIHEYKLQIGL